MSDDTLPVYESRKAPLMAGEVFVAPVKKRVEELEAEVSGIRMELEKLVRLVGSRFEDDKELEGWKPVYRFHPPGFKDDSMRLTVQERRDGHVYEFGYHLEVRDVPGEEPRLRIRKMGGKK